jgi:hypothetical protein
MRKFMRRCNVAGNWLFWFIGMANFGIGVAEMLNGNTGLVCFALGIGCVAMSESCKNKVYIMKLEDSLTSIIDVLSHFNKTRRIT